MSSSFHLRARVAALRLPHHPGRAEVHQPALVVPTLEPGERAVRTWRSSGAVTAVGSSAALHHRTPGGAWRRIPWADVVAVGRTPDGRVTVRAWAGVNAGTIPELGRQVTLEIEADRGLAAYTADRMAHLCVLRRPVRIAPGVEGVVEAVRASDRTPVRWRVWLLGGDAPAAACDPAIAAACVSLVAELRSLAGQ